MPDNGPSVYTTMTLADDVGVVVRGGVDSVAFCLADGLRHHYMAPWHLWCAVTHPFRFARSRGPVMWRPR